MTKKDKTISYIKGVALLTIMAIHVIDWGNFQLTAVGNYYKQFLYLGVIHFVGLSGAVVFLAYANSKRTIQQASTRLIKRGLQLVAIYYIYNFLKFYFYDFSKEDFYGGYISRGIFNPMGLLKLDSFAVPIPVIWSIGVFLVGSPLLIYISRQVVRPNLKLFIIWLILTALANLPILPDSELTNWLFAKDMAMFALLPWSTVFLGGYLVYSSGIYKKPFLSSLIAVILITLSTKIKSIDELRFLEYSLHPVTLYAIGYGLLFFAIESAIFKVLSSIVINSKTLFARLINFKLEFFEILGDNSLWLYIGHWVVIDIVYYFYPHAMWVLFFAVTFFILFYHHFILIRKAEL